MRTVSVRARYLKVRRAFSNIEELAGVINRSKNYTAERLVIGQEDFTRREKLLILEFLGVDKGRSEEYFPEYLEGER